MQATSSVEHDNIMPTQLGGLQGALGNINGHLPLNDRQGRNLGLFTEQFELFLGGRATYVERGHQHFFLVLVLQEFGDLGG